MTIEKSDKKLLPTSNFDLKTSWFHKILYGTLGFGSAGVYAFHEEHNKGYLLISIIASVGFALSIKRVRKHFRTVLGDDKALTHVEIKENPPIDKE
ncbi:MAG: hypothetical protein A2V81_01480 [Candidatus Abawacabacteria bacterium RBG_16_42_10]|uniref:Uncharacterized protein n=1 Tax=Candidatus Abawacabacteria bacterium RBG_16_42_10 TaxID=1817814 RepID=A0A1F4XM31_9BACT|nr:MAG: hypothetical protein A2V81_01480 [Candidatus Abawacabacteria bacterium RBG_16_42_10]